MTRWLLALALLLGACSVDPGAHPSACGEGDTCPAGRRCFHPDGVEQGYCVVDDDCEPTDEVCNGADDDCDDDVDEGFAMVAELCNEVDDDCDGRVDETFDLTTAERCGGCERACVAPNPMCVPDGSGGVDCGSMCDRTRFTDCGADLCVDPMSDERHCGGCGVRCDPGEDCVEGACRCGGLATGEDCAGTTASTCCGTRCVDLNTDPEHCGACADRCARSGGTRVACADGRCDCGDCREPRGCLNLLLMECI